jgi:hypothetical protein
MFVRERKRTRLSDVIVDTFLDECATLRCNKTHTWLKQGSTNRDPYGGSRGGGGGSDYTTPFVFFVPDGRKKTTMTFGAVNNNSVCDALHSKTQESKTTRDG